MNSYIFLCVVALGVAAHAMPSGAGQYTDRYDNIDLDQLIHNDRMFKPYLECAMGRGRCTPDGKELKSHIGEALENNCANCTDKQREGARKVIAHLINNKPEYWAQLTAKYDPQRKYVAKYEKELRTVQG